MHGMQPFLHELRVATLSHSICITWSTMSAFLCEETHPGPKVIERAIAVVEEHGWDASFHLAYLITQLPHTRTSGMGRIKVDCHR